MNPRILTTTIGLLLTATILHAQTWDGGGANDNLNNAANWNPDGIPIPTADVIFGGAVRLTPNVSAIFSVNSLTFNNTAGAFVFGGASTLNLKAGGLVSNDTTLQTFNNPVSFSGAATSTINAASGGLTLNGAVTLPTSTLTLDGVNTITFGSTITGTGAITKTGAGPFRFDATATAIGADFNLNAGLTTLVAGTTQTFSAGSTIAVNGSASLLLSDSVTLDGAQLTRASGAVITVGSGKTLTIQNGGDAIITGAFNFTSASPNLVVTGAGSTFQTTTASGTLTIDSSATLAVQSGGSVSLAAGLNIEGTVTVDGAGSSLSALGSNSFWGNTGANVSVSFTNGGIGNFASSLTIANSVSTALVQVLTGADVSNSGNLSLGDTTNLGTGILTVDGAGSTWTQTGSSAIILGDVSGSTATLNVQNSGTFTTGTGTTFVSPTGTINLNGGTLTVNGALSNLGGTVNLLGGPLTTSGALTNSGTMNLTAGTLTAEAALTNSGTLTLNGGTLTANGALTNSGTFNFTAGTLNLSGANILTVGNGGLLGTNLTLLAGRTVNVANTTTVDAARVLTLDGGMLRTATLVNNGTLDFQRGTLGITGAGGFNIGTGALGGSVTLGAGATLEVTNTLTVSAAASLTLSGGGVAGAAVSNSGSVRLNAGAFAASGTFTNANGASLTVNGGSFTGAAVSNSGSVRLDAGVFSTSGAFTNASGGTVFVSDFFSVGGTLTNSAGGRITLRDGTGNIPSTQVLSFLLNSGLITGDGTIGKPTFNNATGELRAEAGKTLVITGALSTPNAGVFSLQGGTLEFTQAISNGSTGFISGHGTLRTGGLGNSGNIAVSGGNADVFGDVTNSAGARIVTSGGATTTFFDDVVHNGTEIRTSAGGSSVFFGAVSGAGPYTGTGTVYFEGDLRPGNSPASVLYEGDLVLGNSATLTLELGGLVLGGQYDHLNIGGTFTEDGALDVVLYGGFAPRFGDTFDLFDAGAVAGNFDDINLPALSGGLTWDDTQLSTSGTLRVVPEPGIGTLLLSALGFLGTWRGRIRGARASRVLVSASRRNELPCAINPGKSSAHDDTPACSAGAEFLKNRTSKKVRFGGTPKPARGTRALPGTSAPRAF